MRIGKGGVGVYVFHLCVRCCYGEVVAVLWRFDGKGGGTL